MSNDRKVFSISMVKNEADIIESFVRYHLHILDGMVILDHGSTDNTPNILEKIQSEGLPIFVKRNVDIQYNQAEITTKLLYETIDQHNPDLVFCLDADEFITCPYSSGNPRQLINTLDLNELYHVDLLRYFPEKVENKDELFIPKKLIQCQKEIEHGHKVVISKNIVKKYLPEVMMGNHGCSFNKVNANDLKSYMINGLFLAHYPIRSIEHLKSKVLTGWISNLTRHNRHEVEGHHWRTMFNKLKGNINTEDFHEIFNIPPLEKKPINLSFCKGIEIKYTMPDEINGIKNLLEYCELLALDYAALKRQLLQNNV